MANQMARLGLALDDILLIKEAQASHITHPMLTDMGLTDAIMLEVIAVDGNNRRFRFNLAASAAAMNSIAEVLRKVAVDIQRELN